LTNVYPNNKNNNNNNNNNNKNNKVKSKPLELRLRVKSTGSPGAVDPTKLCGIFYEKRSGVGKLSCGCFFGKSDSSLNLCVWVWYMYIA
jgi:hypothetical protein